MQVDLMLLKLYQGKKVNIRFEGLYIMGITKRSLNLVFFYDYVTLTPVFFLSMQHKLDLRE